MKRYFIQLYHITEQTRELSAIESGFSLIMLAIDEWNQLPGLLASESGINDKFKVWDEDYRFATDKDERIIPHLAHLAPKVHTITLCDIDVQGKENGISFFILPKSVILIDNNKMLIPLIERWAKRGILDNPIDMAFLLGLYILDNYQQRLERFENDLFQLEKDILKSPEVNHQNNILSYHQLIMSIRKSINMHQSVFEHMSDLSNSENKLEQDLRSTTTRIIGNIQNYHDQVENLRDAYQTAVQNNTNDIMKLLTIIATTLLPINLMTSFFGMNFMNLPLVDNPYGIIVFYIVSILLVILILSYFGKQKWLRFWHKVKE
ncbi:CorA family divalent cation transporter [Desulfosporosinus sp. OT]|uniref:CorA family divalent cation transporter n=1 Tax=Desulfosporosinus sp. OT TaxID=913865 RepID=UPI000223A0C0|nr:CorA family divalent cation transporter [Desulfosporosinus sp. OT]EGW35881.1 corA-like Mg2+ transporter family protein [Desulfosporosinus sp. OT]